MVLLALRTGGVGRNRAAVRAAPRRRPERTGVGARGLLALGHLRSPMRVAQESAGVRLLRLTQMLSSGPAELVQVSSRFLVVLI